MLLKDRGFGGRCICCKFLVSGWEGPGIRVWDARVPADHEGLKDRTACALGRPECALSFLGQRRTNVPWRCSRRAEEERARKEGIGESKREFQRMSQQLTPLAKERE